VARVCLVPVHFGRLIQMPNSRNRINHLGHDGYMDPLSESTASNPNRDRRTAVPHTRIEVGI